MSEGSPPRGAADRTTRSDPTRPLPAAGASVAAVVVTDRAVCLEPVERRADAATVAAPGLGTLLDRNPGDQESDDRVEPPRPERRVAEKADEQRAGKVRTKDVLAPL